MSGAARLQGKVYAGLAKAAAKLGEPHDIYRPVDPLRPLRLIDRVATVPAVFDSAPGYKFGTPARADNPVRYGLIDGAQLQPGDYISGPTGVLFVAALPALQPVSCILCNTTLTMRRPAAPRGFGSVEPPGGEVDVFVGWPASLLHAGRAGADDAPVPGDTNPATYRALLPVIPGVEPPPRAGDTMTDERGRRFGVDIFDDTALGWRLTIRLLAVE